MSSYTPNTDLWLERSRLAGMVLAAMSYGIFFLLTLQATAALTQRPHHVGQIARHRWMLLGYVWITFILATIGFAGNARYTEMIWIDLRDAPGGPAALILDEMSYWINMMALTCYYIMEWFMQALLLYRCFVLWAWQKRVVVPMTTIFAAMVAMSILVLAEANGAVFYNINTQLAYLCLQVGLTLIYTLLVACRLLVLRKKTLGSERRLSVRVHGHHGRRIRCTVRPGRHYLHRFLCGALGRDESRLFVDQPCSGHRTVVAHCSDVSSFWYRLRWSGAARRAAS